MARAALGVEAVHIVMAGGIQHVVPQEAAEVGARGSALRGGAGGGKEFPPRLLVIRPAQAADGGLMERVIVEEEIRPL